jgi:oxygen-dependent protoporphyrinogen oxidase
MNVDAAVIGGGVSGLTAAHELLRRGHRVVVLERQVRAGGNAISERVDGFLMEHGPSSVNAASSAAAELSAAFGLDPLRCGLGPGVRYRYLTGTDGLHRISTHPLGFLLSNCLSPGARLRVLAEPVIPRADGAVEESVAGFWSRRFGPEFAERVIDPLTGGLFAGRAEELSMAAVFPKLTEMERRHGSIVLALLKSRRAGAKMPGRQLYSWRGGMAALPRALAESLGPALSTGVTVRRIRAAPGGYRIEAGAAGSLAARAIVLATQPHVAAGLLENLDAAGAAAAGAIDAPPLAVVFLGYRRGQIDHPLDGLGYLTPARAGRALNGALFCSTMFPGRAPAGHVALAGYIGGARAPEAALAASGDLIAAARAEYRDLLGATGDPVVARVRQWPRGLPQYRIGHGAQVAALNGLEARRPGLFVTGNYLAGPAVGTCIDQAAAAAARVHAWLSAAPAADRDGIFEAAAH